MSKKSEVENENPQSENVEVIQENSESNVEGKELTEKKLVKSKSKAIKTLKEHKVSYHDTVKPLEWYLYPAKDFKESNYKKAGQLYKLPSKQLATELFFEAELSEEGYKLLSGHELNRLFSLAIRKVREHVKH